MRAYGVLSLVFFLLAYSVWARVKRYRQTLTADTRPSLLSLAIQDLVGTAGGVYLSLIMLVSFLKVDIPSVIRVFNISVDPLASLSIGLAILQPLAAKLCVQKS